ncbi:MAG TPA: PKD domain-containing protein, partial [Bacteroidia bacterium]|nr:PKD domain-containing protein [Bacteroidia bacterium]
TGTYSWTPSTGLSATIGPTVTVTPSVTTTYSVTGIDLTGCSTTVVTSVTAYTLPILSVNSGTICAGKNVTLHAQGANTYSWSPATGLSSNVGSTVIASPANTTTYVVLGMNINTCITVDTIVVRVNPLPGLVETPQIATGCEPLCVNFSNTSASSSGNYNWSFGDGKTDNTSAPWHCFSQGSYTVHVTLTDSNGCVSTSTSTVVAFPTPIANFYASPQPTTILDPEIHFTNGTSGGALVTSWKWTFGDGHGTSTDVNPYYYYKDTGTFAVQLVAVSNLGCRDSITINVIIDDEYLIYVPNAFTPNFDGVNDIFMPKAEGVTDFKMYVYDRWGKLAFYTTDLYIGWDGRHLNQGNQIAQEDTYVWKIEAKNKKGEPRILKGIVSLVK